MKMCKKAMSMVLALAMVVRLNGASVGAKRKWRKRDDNKRNCRR